MRVRLFALLGGIAVTGGRERAARRLELGEDALCVRLSGPLALAALRRELRTACAAIREVRSPPAELRPPRALRVCTAPSFSDVRHGVFHWRGRWRFYSLGESRRAVTLRLDGFKLGGLAVVVLGGRPRSAGSASSTPGALRRDQIEWRDMTLPVLAPMLATLGPLPSDEDAWAYEIKWDGIRTLGYIEGGRLRLASRSGIDITARYPELAPLAAPLDGRDAILDGEIVAFDQDGAPSFERLQPRMNLTQPRKIAALSREAPVVLEIFDLLWLDDRPLLDSAYLERRERLAALELDGERWQTPGYRLGGGRELLAASRARGLEGIIAKRPQSTYRPGRRTREWVKVKNSSRQELVIGGWLPGEGRRAHLGALLVGYYDPTERDPDGRPVFRYAGKVGTGFSEAELARLQRLLDDLAIDTSPFVGRQPPAGARFVRPELVAEIEFTEWTRDGMLRHPSYKGLRDDKHAGDVIRELPTP